MKRKILTPEDKEYILAETAKGTKASVIADALGIAVSTVHTTAYHMRKEQKKKEDTTMAGTPEHFPDLRSAASPEERRCIAEAMVYASKHPVPEGCRLDGTPAPKSVAKAETDLVEAITKPVAKPSPLPMVEATYKGYYTRLTVGTTPSVEVFAQAEGDSVAEVLRAAIAELQAAVELAEKGVTP